MAMVHSGLVSCTNVVIQKWSCIGVQGTVVQTHGELESFSLTSCKTWEPGIEKLEQSLKSLVGNQNAIERSGLPKALPC